jgi:predicted phosphodiesterase
MFPARAAGDTAPWWDGGRAGSRLGARGSPTVRTIAHLSDLHIGKDAANDARAAQLCQALQAAGVDRVLLSGDVTHRGRVEELATFRRLFAPLADRLAVVPGNHDRLGEDAGRWLMAGRVQVEAWPGLHLVRLDSTAPHNRSLLDAHGELSRRDITAVEQALGEAAPGALVVLMLHHHLHALPEDCFFERLSTLVGWPNASELLLGGVLLRRLAGRCDLVLHGHRHARSELLLSAGGERPLRVLNAGASPELMQVRILAHAGGRVRGERWLAVEPGQGASQTRQRRLRVAA